MDLQKIIDDLLFLEDDFGELRNAAQQYYCFLSEITQISDETANDKDESEISLNSGTAISPKDAARCVLDFMRTAKFLRSIHRTILEAQKRFPNEKIEILYAGCGPFASLAIPACKKFRSTEITFSLIDIHQRSLDSAKAIFKSLAIEDHISRYIRTDATTYKNNTGKKFHIIISETMQKTLAKEPQVAITLNLTNYLREDGFFIPQKITVDAFLANMEREFSPNRSLNLQKERIHLGRIFELSVKTAASKKDVLKPTTITIPKDEAKNMWLLLSTNIILSDDIMLEDYDSGITYPTILNDFPHIQVDQQFEFQYVLGKNPHFQYNLLNGQKHIL